MSNLGFVLLKEVALDRSETWMGKMALTFDVDWASDEVLEYTLDLLEESGKAATIFVTHDTPVLSRIRENPLWEIGLHPNFVLSAGALVGLDTHVENVLSKMKAWAPEAISLRSHGLVTANRWLWQYEAQGIKNLSMSLKFNIKSQPHEEINGLVECPIYFSENSQLVIQQKGGVDLADITQLGQVADDELRVFDFHPIHICLNTENYERYENSRHVHSDWKQLDAYRNKTTEGAEFWLREVLNL